MTSTDPQHVMAATTAQPPATTAQPPEPATTGARTTGASTTGASLWDRLDPRPRVGRWRDVTVGAAFEAEEFTAGLVAGLRRVAARRDSTLAGLADRGARERARGRQRAGDALRSAVTTVATSPVVDAVVDAQLERILRPVIRAVLDDVLLLLEQEPERIQTLVRGQRDSMVDELVTRVRTGVAAGDTVVDRMAFRMFHRAPRATPVVDGQ